VSHAVVIHNDIERRRRVDIFQNITVPTSSASRARISGRRTGSS